MPSARTSRILLVVVLAIGAVGCPIMWHLYTCPDRPATSRAWDATMAAMDEDPAVLQAFLAERTFVRDGAWDYRWMPAPFQHVWATLRFERGCGPSGPESPTIAEAAEAYRAMELDDVADLVLRLGEALAGGDRRRTEVATCRQAITAARPRILAARRTYLEAHRQDIEGD